jgi:hypothetical protein
VCVAASACWWRSGAAAIGEHEHRRNIKERDHRGQQHAAGDRHGEGRPELAALEDQGQEAAEGGDGRRDDVPARIHDHIAHSCQVAAAARASICSAVRMMIAALIETPMEPMTPISACTPKG